MKNINYELHGCLIKSNILEVRIPTKEEIIKQRKK